MPKSCMTDRKEKCVYVRDMSVDCHAWDTFLISLDTKHNNGPQRLR